jgi:hypothetical protein
MPVEPHAIAHGSGGQVCEFSAGKEGELIAVLSRDHDCGGIETKRLCGNFDLSCFCYCTLWLTVTCK